MSEGWKIELRSRDAIGSELGNSGTRQHLYLTLVNNHGVAAAEIHGAQKNNGISLKFALPPVKQNSSVSYYLFGGDSPHVRQMSPYLDSAKRHWKPVATVASGSEEQILKAWKLAKQEVKNIKAKNIEYTAQPELTVNKNDANSNSVVRGVLETLKQKTPGLKINIPNLNINNYPGYSIRAQVKPKMQPNTKMARLNPASGGGLRV
jgi:hypothetical protein